MPMKDKVEAAREALVAARGVRKARRGDRKAKKEKGNPEKEPEENPKEESPKKGGVAVVLTIGKIKGHETDRRQKKYGAKAAKEKKATA